MLDFHRKVCTRHDYYNLSSEFIHEESVNSIAEKYSQKLDILIFLKGIEYNFYQQKNNSFKGLWKYFLKEKKYSANPRLCISWNQFHFHFKVTLNDTLFAMFFGEQMVIYYVLHSALIFE